MSVYLFVGTHLVANGFKNNVTYTFTEKPPSLLSKPPPPPLYGNFRNDFFSSIVGIFAFCICAKGYLFFWRVRNGKNYKSTNFAYKETRFRIRIPMDKKSLVKYTYILPSKSHYIIFITYIVNKFSNINFKKLRKIMLYFIIHIILNCSTRI